MERLEFHRLAEHELNEAAQYYDLEEPGLGSSFLEEVDRCLQSIEAHPGAGPIIRGLCVGAFFVDSLTPPLQDHAHRYPYSRGDESQASSHLLGGSRLTARQPDITFDRTAGSHSLAAAGQRERLGGYAMTKDQNPRLRRDTSRGGVPQFAN